MNQHEQDRTDLYNFYTQVPASQPQPRLRGLPHDKPYINVILFLLTILSTYLTGGFWYSLAIISILLAHEMGHYLMCRRYGVTATLPYFIPFPLLNPFGTMGAVIQMKGYIPNRKALFDIGAAGPIAGFVLTIPAIYFGVSMSNVVNVSDYSGQGFQLGESLLFKLVAIFAKGTLPEGTDIVLHPLGYAGWAGLFVTALNLLPIGQLDGGHIIYSIFGRRYQYFTYSFLFALGILSVFYIGWAILFLLLVLIGRKHPAPIDDFTKLNNKRKLLGAVILIIFIMSFTPFPFRF